MTIDVKDIPTFCEEYGDPAHPAVLMLSGWMAKASVYRLIGQTLSERYHVLIPDMPGFGGDTPEPAAPWDLDGFVDYTIALTEALGLDSLILIGHSFGGRIIIKMMNRDALPFKVERIILIDAAGIKHDLPKQVQRRQKLFRIAGQILPDDIVERYKKSHGSADYRAASPVMRECMVRAINEDLTPLLPGVTPETLLIWGTEDTATPLSDGEKMEQTMPDAGLAKIPGAGHFCFSDSPAVFENILRSYML